MSTYMNKIHENNFKIIREYNLKVGDKFVRKSDTEHNNIIIVRSIHPLYGWCVAHSDKYPSRWEINQDMRNIKDFIKIK